MSHKFKNYLAVAQRFLKLRILKIITKSNISSLCSHFKMLRHFERLKTCSFQYLKMLQAFLKIENLKDFQYLKILWIFKD